MRYCEKQEIDAYIPNFGLYKPVREGFIYNKELDQYECTRGNKAVLPFRRHRITNDGREKKIYWSDNSKCKNCPLRKKCIGKGSFKKLDDMIDKPYYDRMHEKMQTPYAKKISRIRSRTVEPVLGTLLNFLNMRRVNTRGIELATKHVITAALCYNLNKCMRFKSNKAESILRALPLDQKGAYSLFFRLFLAVYRPVFV